MLISKHSGPGDLGGLSAMLAPEGVADYSGKGLVLDVVGAYVLQAGALGLSVLSDPILITRKCGACLL